MSVIRDLFTSSVNSTMMSINERFTYLQKNVRPVQTSILTIRANNAARQQASAKNRRLAMQMERRLSAMAALKLKKKSIRQRLGTSLVMVGPGSNVRDRLSLPGRGRGRGRNAVKNVRNRGRSLRRTQSVQSLTGGTLQRSRSMQSINNDALGPRRSRSRSRTRNRTPSAGPKETGARQARSSSGIRQGRLKKTINTGFFGQQVTPQRRIRSNSVNFGNRRARNINNQGMLKDHLVFRRGGGRRRNMNGSFQSTRGQGQFRGRGGRGRGRGQSRNARSNRNGQAGQVPTKEELDQELELYMANTKSHLDNDIDNFIQENMDVVKLE